MKEAVIAKSIGCAALLAVIAALCGGCSVLTIAPKPITASAPSIDGNVANSGIVGLLADGSVMVTPGYIARYNGLIGDGYGVGFVPALHQGAGYRILPDAVYTVQTHKAVFAQVKSAGNYAIDAEHAAAMAVMATAHRSGAPK